jgi:hypothetical protein
MQISVFAALTYEEKLPLVFFPRATRINSAIYCEHVLDNCIVPWMNVHDPDRTRFVYQEDGAPTHWARNTERHKDAHRIVRLQRGEWPAMSPDLAVLDFYVWPWLQARVCFTLN